MTRLTNHPILSELRTASSPASQVKALKDLKNELIGHDQKKELWIGLGILTPLARILNSHKDNGQKKQRDVNASDGRGNDRSVNTDEEEAQLQAIIVLGSLAYGGSAFIPPIYSAFLIPRLLSLLSPSESHPQTVLHVLRTLNTIADSICLSPPKQEEHELGLSNLLYTQQHLSSVSILLQQTSSYPSTQQQVGLAASLIYKTCQKEQQRAIAAQGGILEALAVTATPAVLGTLRYRTHAKTDLQLASILQAVKAIITDSKARGLQFLRAPALTSAFLSMETEGTNMAEGFAWSSGFSNTSHVYRSSLKAMESLMPQVPNTHPRNTTNSQNGYPPLGRIGASDRQPQGSRSLSTAIEIIQSQGLEYVGEEESPLIPLLVYIFRSSDEATNLAAAGLLVTLHRLGLTKRPKESVFALLLVPSLVRMLDKDAKLANPQVSGTLISTEEIIMEGAPEILATLTNSCVETQNAAVDAGAIKKLSQLLKESFDPLPTSATVSIWNAESTLLHQSPDRGDASRLGSTGLHHSTRLMLRLRESVLTALAAIASEKDEYRKAVIDNGVVPFVIRTLQIEPVEDRSSPPNNPANDTSNLQLESTWNYRDVVLAACGAARALSRSVSTLRTSLMDAGLPAPLFALLKSQDIEIQIAATGVLCNLVLKFSPMRNAIMEGGAMKTLCDQAHSPNAKLRLNSMWALRNIVAGASNPTKMTCLRELGPEWLKQIVTNDSEGSSPTTNSRLEDNDDGCSTPIRMSTPNAAGQRVDLLNAVDEDSREASRDVEGDAKEGLKMSDSIGALAKADRDRKQHLWASQTNGDGFPGTPTGDIGLHALSPRALSDGLAIQKEGLEFIRNLICGEHSPEMIDHLFRELGQDKVFELLTSKLRPRILNAFTRDRRSSENGVSHIQPHTEILISTCFTLVHIACGHPKHRQLLVFQTELLKLLLPLFSHPCREIRVGLCWMIINTIWVEDNADKSNAKLRARELAKLGFVEKLDALEKDESLDCRERAKHARDQMKQLLHI